MKGSKIIAGFFAAALCFMQCTSVFAEFADPADAYADYMSGRRDSVTEPAETTAPVEETEQDITEEPVSEEPVTEEPAPEEPADGGSAADDKGHNSKVSHPASEVVIYSYKTSVFEGETFKIGYRLKPSNSDDTIEYLSSNSKVASIDAKGNVSALSKGSAVITVKAGSGVKDRFTLTVKQSEGKDKDTDDKNTETAGGDDSLEDDVSDSDGKAKHGAEDIELRHSAVTVYQGDTYQIICRLVPENCGDTVSYRSANRAIASVDENGLVTARGAGNTRITCTTGSGKKVKLNITVEEVVSSEELDVALEEEAVKKYDEDGNLLPTMVRFAEESVSVQIGDTVSLDARVYPSGAKYTYTIHSDDTNVAKVNTRGEVTGIGEGNAIITLTTDNGVSDTVYVTVYGNVIPGIDVSKWNGDIDWKKVKETGKVRFAMIRASYGREDTDPRLHDNVRGCEENGIPYGFYHYTYAVNVAEAHKEAAYFLNVISPYSPKYPVVLDIEEAFYKDMPKQTVTEIVTAFMEDLENAGYYAMVYSYSKFFNDCLIMDKLTDYDIWVACWGDKEKLFENYSYHYGMWQYTETGTLSGIDEYVDLNYSYKDYRATIEKYNLNIPRYR